MKKIVMVVLVLFFGLVASGCQKEEPVTRIFDKDGKEILEFQSGGKGYESLIEE